MILVTRKSIYQTFDSKLNLLPLYNTGIDNNGNLLPDGTIGVPNWQLISSPGGTSNLRVRSSVGGFPIPPYVGDNSTSRWIGPNNSNSLESPEGFYTFRTQFDLTLKSLSQLKIVGRYSVDDNLFDIKINNLSTSIVGSGFSSWTSFQISSGFIVGRNLLDFLVYNGSPSNNPIGLRVEMFLQN